MQPILLVMALVALHQTASQLQTLEQLFTHHRAYLLGLHPQVLHLFQFLQLAAVAKAPVQLAVTALAAAVAVAA
jgi:hypothetical protein